MNNERKELIERYPALAQIASDSGWTPCPGLALREIRKVNKLVREGELETMASKLPSGKAITLYRWAKSSRFRSSSFWLQDDLMKFAEALADSQKRSQLVKQAWARRRAAQ